MLSLKQIHEFSIIGPLKTGSFGTVYAAKDKSSRFYAIKILDPAKPRKKRSFFFFQMPKPLKEGEILAKLQKIQGIPRLFYYGENPDINRDIIVTELLGEDLGSRFLKKKRFSMEYIAKVAENLIDILSAIHKKGVIHCDIKPDNILSAFSEADQLYLVDFGLSKRSALKTRKSYTKKFVGNLTFSAYECHFFRTPQKKHDFQALGYVLLYFLRGSLPWEEIDSESLEEKVHKIGVRKRNFVENELGTVPFSLRSFFEYVVKLRDSEKIDAVYLKKLMNSLRNEEDQGGSTGVSKKSCNLSTANCREEEEGFFLKNFMIRNEFY